jgi:hypothetical protein
VLISTRLITILLILGCASTVVARAVGVAQPANAATLGFVEGCDDKPQPCWYGVVPGITNGSEAFRRLSDAGFSRTSIVPARYGDEAHVYARTDFTDCQTILQYNSNNQHIQRIQLVCGGIQFGDMIAVKGAPTGIHKTTGYASRLLFTGNISAIESVSIDTTSLFSPLGSIDLRAESISDDATPTFGWHGLAPLWRYCALEFAPICANVSTP